MEIEVIVIDDKLFFHDQHHKQPSLSFNWVKKYKKSYRDVFLG